jgi:hypothetical protein
VRHAKKVDLGHGEIRDELRAKGYAVSDFSHLGGGFPDLAVFLDDPDASPFERSHAGGRTVLLEIKSKRGKLTPAQVRFHALWKGPLYTVRSVVEALAVLGHGRTT